MRKLVWVLLVVGAASQAAGCFFSSGDDGDDTTGGDPQITATFDVYSGGPGGVLCQPQQGFEYRGVDFVRVNARLTGTQGAGFSDVYNCDVQAARTPPLTTGPGDYDIWVDYGSDRGFPNDPNQWVITDTTQSVTVFVRAGENLQVAADLRLDNGFFEGNWSLSDTNGNAIASCSDIIGQDGVSMIGTIAGTTTAVEDIFNCEDGFNSPTPVITSPAPLGNYVYSFALLNANQQAIGESGDITGAAIIDGNDYEDLGVVDIQLF